MSCFILGITEFTVSSVIRIITSSTRAVNDVVSVWKIQMETSLVVIKTVRVCLDVNTLIGVDTVKKNV